MARPRCRRRPRHRLGGRPHRGHRHAARRRAAPRDAAPPPASLSATRASTAAGSSRVRSDRGRRPSDLRTLSGRAPGINSHLRPTPGSSRWDVERRASPTAAPTLGPLHDHVRRTRSCGGGNRRSGFRVATPVRAARFTLQDMAVPTKNWAGNQRCLPRQVHEPSFTDEVAAIVRIGGGSRRACQGDRLVRTRSPTPR